MARPEFALPDFVKDSEPEQIQERMMGNLPADISDMEGDFPYDFTKPTAIEISQFIQFDIVRALMIAFPEYAWGDWLDLHGSQAGVSRRAAVCATGTVSVTAEYGTVIPAGSVFAVPGTDQMEMIAFRTTEAAAFSEAGTADIGIEAVAAGTSGNVAANTITIMSAPVKGVTAITNREKTTGGAEREDDNSYYQRIHAEYEDSQFYVGNDADYVKWAKEVPGIGDCIVEAAAEGPGTVRLILSDSSGRPASEKLQEDVYNHIVSPGDRRKRLLPTGTAKLIVDAATVRRVDFACTGLLLDGVSLEQVVSDFREAMLQVYSAAKTDNVIRYNRVRAALMNISGVRDFADISMDGEKENIVVRTDEYPETGEVLFEVQEAVT